MRSKRAHVPPPLFMARKKPETGNCEICPFSFGPNISIPWVEIPGEENMVCIRNGGICQNKKPEEKP
jgi:hypothetical protein